ncbi:unnamed protein product [Caenorhabditis bovis]|uniref:Tr-type G domain-containing protein n=1 Tax=Caenorhabditis bovis TaxID=2654633 RepID=A0A8S1EVI3_9PELO|nr:unnamed protein product [Caenorhabditis bovis]
MRSLNVGILGHVDCGKTTLTKRLAQLASTSAFDKHAEAGGRRNTLDLGFSSVIIADRRIALIDCPGHSALIRAVLASSNVFDMAIMAQTAEHLLLVSIFCPRNLIIVLNKIDLIEAAEIENVKKKLRRGLKTVGVDEKCAIVEMSLHDDHFQQERLDVLKVAIEEKLFEPERFVEKPLLVAIDHCFSIKGKGTILTGSVIQGKLNIGHDIEFPCLNETRRVKTLQCWKENVNAIEAGERAAMMVSNFDETKFSRTIVSSPGYLQSIKECLASVNPITFFRSAVKSKTKMHISIGYETIMAECQFLRDFGDEFEQLSEMEAPCVVLLKFEKPVHVCPDSSTFFMASRLDQNGKGCRFAFTGVVQKILSENDQIPRFSRKCRTGIIERVENDGFSAICTGMFKPETNFDVFRDMKVTTSDGTIGRIEGAFGKNGKFRVIFDAKIAPKQEIELNMKKYLHQNLIKSYLK